MAELLLLTWGKAEHEGPPWRNTAWHQSCFLGNLPWTSKRFGGLNYNPKRWSTDPKAPLADEGLGALPALAQAGAGLLLSQQQDVHN